MRLRQILTFVFITLAVALLPCQIYAQVQTKAKVIADANEKFEREDYTSAMPLYSQLLSNDKNNANYNYRYGVCVLFASAQKEKGLQFLEIASKFEDVDGTVWFYLGKAYHLNYQFENAIGAYSKFKSVVGIKKAAKYKVDNEIEMCRTGTQLLQAITDITVFDKAELNETDFFRRYDLSSSDYSGKLLVKPDEFKTSLDKKKGEQSVIFLSGEKDELYFASYGTDATKGKDIFVVHKLFNGTWGKPENLGFPINTEYDEDFPFMHPNGKILYFSSKGPNSMGGYDIFRSAFDEETGTWEKPVNLDFPVNSADDDIMFVSDLTEKTAWFASSRSSPDGRMVVYHVVVERKPINVCLISGTFTSTDGDPNRVAKITVKLFDSNELIGEYYSSEETGAYMISLPKSGGKYSFTVKHSGIADQTEIVSIPAQGKIKAINQKIGYADVNNETKLVIQTNFDTDISLINPAFLKDKANLDLTPVASPTDPVVVESQSTDILIEDPLVVDPAANVPSSSSRVGNEELVKSANEDALATQTEVIELENQKARVYNYAAQLNVQTKIKKAEVVQAKSQADAMAEGPGKIAANEKVAELQSQVNALQAQTTAATTIGNALETDVKNKKLEADKAKQFSISIANAVKSKDIKVMDEALKQQVELEALSGIRSEGDLTAKNIQDEAEKKRTKFELEKNKTQDLKEEIAANQTRIDQLKIEQAKEKDIDLKEGIAFQIEGVTDDINANKKQLAVVDQNLKNLENQYNDLANQSKAANEAIVESKNPSNSSVAMNAIDKKALENDVKIYQQTISEIGVLNIYAPIVSKNPISNNPVVEVNNTKPGTESDKNSNVNFAKSIQDLDKVSDPVVRNNAKVKVYNEWVASLEEQMSETKQEIAGTSDKKKKEELNVELKKLQKESIQIKQDSKQSLLAVENLNKGKDAAIIRIEGKYNQQLIVAEKEPDLVVKGNLKAQVYNEWADSLESIAIAREKSVLKIKKIAAQEKAKQEIMAFKVAAMEKRNLAEDAIAKPVEPVVATAPLTPTMKDPVGPILNYSDPIAKQAIEEQRILLSKAERNRINKDSLTQLANATAGAKRTQLLSQATEEQRQAWNKDSEAAAKLGEADKIQFENNNKLINSFEVSQSNSSNDLVSKSAVLLKDANTFFEKAKEDRAMATTATTNYIRASALKSAEENENKAIQKQQDAIKLYQENGFVVLDESIIAVQNPSSLPIETTSTPVAPQNDVTNSQEKIINAQTGQPLSMIEINQLKASGLYLKYMEETQLAVNAEKEVIELKKLEAKYQEKIGLSISKSTEFSIQAAKEPDPIKKKSLTTKSNKFSSTAAADMNSRDSIAELVTRATKKANDIREKEKLALMSIDPEGAENIIAIAKSEQKSKSVATPVLENVPVATPVVENVPVTTPVVENVPVTTPVVENVPVATPVVENVPVATPVVENVPVTTPVVENVPVTTPVVENIPVVTPVVANTPATRPITNAETNTSTESQNISTVGKRLAEGEEFKIVTKNTARGVTAINLNPSLPEGLVYKVQIGAFRNPIAPEIYKELSPVSAETTTNGLTRYTAGLFNKFANANSAKVEVRALGYRDAFIVAFLNGKRISMEEANRMSGDQAIPSTVEPIAGTQVTDLNQPIVSTPVNEVTPVEANQENVISIKGLFFTVQIGVYKNPVSNARLKNLPAIVNERTANGFIRYSSGKYCSTEDAIKAKNIAVSKGIADAFVTAYSNSKRITPAEAQVLIGNGTIPCEGVQNANTPSEESTNSTIRNTNQTNESSAAITKAPVPEFGLVFSVQIGAFREEVPIEIVNQFLQLSGSSVKNYKDMSTGLTIYQVGIFGTKEEADTLRKEAVSKGITDSFVIAFKDGQKISIAQALELLKQ